MPDELTEEMKLWIAYWTYEKIKEYERRINSVSPSEYEIAKEIYNVFRKKVETS